MTAGIVQRTSLGHFLLLVSIRSQRVKIVPAVTQMRESLAFGAKLIGRNSRIRASRGTYAGEMNYFEVSCAGSRFLGTRTSRSF
jgi:hypothetical protein